MGLKKYEIITVGSDKRVRALRSWQVGDRYVNIGDVGGIVYDEKTLSQDGACWLFRGNFSFPGARIGGDSIVDVGETALSTEGTPNVDILGSSVVVGSKVVFESGQTGANVVQLTGSHFEQGAFNYAPGANWETMKAPSGNYLRTKNPIFAGGVSTVLKCEVPGYLLNWYALDRDGTTINASAMVTTGVGVTTTVTACQYFLVKLSKNPNASIVPADATAAQIITTAVFETKLVVVDSRLELNQATSTGVITIRPGGDYMITSGAKYPEAVIRNSNVSINAPSVTSRLCWILGQIIESNATLDATGGTVELVGRYRNVKNLRVSGAPLADTDVSAYSIIQATDCNDFAVSPAIFPRLTDARTANMPFIFQGCNVPDGRFYHHAQIANTYRDINFDLATKDLGKTTANEGGVILCSSEVNGMYRLYAPSGSGFGCLVESHESVKSVSLAQVGSTHNTTIYADAYLNGLFDLAGTNVFGNTKKHDTQDVSGCKIVNTGETAVNMKGNIRVEDNATLVNVSVVGSGYFGGKAVASGLLIEGSVFMSDNASFTKTAGVGVIRNLKMTENAYAVLGDYPLDGRIHLSDNARCTPTAAGLYGGNLVMKDNAVISGAVAVGGVITMKDDAKVSAGTLIAYGDITLCGSYNQTVNKTWTGKRTITDVNAPEYDNNVKTKYDF